MVKSLTARILSAAIFFAGSLGAALAQSSPGLVTGQVPTAGQWNSYFAAKQDYLGSPPCLVGGCVLTGKITTSASTTSRAGLSVPPGVAPTSPINGDVWATSAGLYVRVAGATVGPLAAATSSGFAGTSPIGVTFPAGVVTYAFNFSVANTFAAAQTVSLNAGALPTAITGTALRAAQVGGTITRIAAEGYATYGSMTTARADGTAASPTQVLSGEQTGAFSTFAWGSNAAWNGPMASMRTYAAENVSATAWGSKVCWATSALTTTALTDGLCQQPSGGATLGAPTGGDEGVGTLNLAGALYDNGTAPTGTGAYVRATSPSVSGLTVTGAFTATGLVTNADLVNASTTVNGTTCTLGSVCTVTATAASITIATTTVSGGTSGFALTNNAGVLGNSAFLSTLNGLSGARSWSVVVQTFCPSGCTTTIAGGGAGTYTPTAGMVYAKLECEGGGGGGGGAAGGNGSTTMGIGGAAGGGGYAAKIATAATIGASKAVTIGVGGAGGAAGNNAGAAGGATNVGTTICAANGGLQGNGSAAGAAINNAGSAGGPGTAGDAPFLTGQSGGAGVFVGSGIGVGYGGNAGSGAGPLGNAGGAGGSFNTSGIAGTQCGGGGSGGVGSYLNTTAQAGAAGGAGCVRITEYVLN